MSKFCSECGARLKVGAKFCSACGHRVSMEVAQDSPPVEPMPYEKPKTMQEIYAEKKAMATKKPAASSVAEIFAKAKAQAPVKTSESSSVVQSTPPVSKSYSNIQEMYANARTQAANQNYNESSGGWLYETFLRRDGRLNRLRFFKRSLLSTLIGLIGAIILLVVLNPENPNHVLISCIVAAVLVTYLDYGLIVRRTHDLRQDCWERNYIRNDDEFWAKIYVGTQVLRVILFFYETSTHSEIPYQIYLIFDLVFYRLWFMKGEVGTNEYGPDPLERRYY